MVDQHHRECQESDVEIKTVPTNEAKKACNSHPGIRKWHSQSIKNHTPFFLSLSFSDMCGYSDDIRSGGGLDKFSAVFVILAWNWLPIRGNRRGYAGLSGSCGSSIIFIRPIVSSRIFWCRTIEWTPIYKQTAVISVLCFWDEIRRTRKRHEKGRQTGMRSGSARSDIRLPVPVQYCRYGSVVSTGSGQTNHNSNKSLDSFTFNMIIIKKDHAVQTEETSEKIPWLDPTNLSLLNDFL